MVSNYFLTNKAKDDLDNIFRYISVELSNPEAALELIELFESKFKDLLHYPEQYPYMDSDKLEIPDIRKCIVRSYIIAYYIDYSKDAIVIYRVIYHKMNY